MNGITILGATGTIGDNTLAVLRRHKQRFRIHALTAHRNAEKMAELCREWMPRYAVMADADAAQRLTELLRPGEDEVEVLSGSENLCRVAEAAEVDSVMAAIVGAAGLLPTLAAVHAGKRVLLANKEVLVMAGRLFMEAVRDNQSELLPIDSEHNAVFQCLQGNQRGALKRIILTASGGPFHDYSLEQLETVTPEQACAHPNWVMGRKISVDSATMMNKGLEVIEACWLFDTTPDHIEVLVHPQSIVHSLVEYADASVLAQLSHPDMKIPIAYALGWPERLESGAAPLDLAQLSQLQFKPGDRQRFPCLRLAYEAMLAGGTTPAILNAANEVAVAAFLEHKLGFTQIASVIEATLADHAGRQTTHLHMVLEDDLRAREIAGEHVQRMEG